MRYAKDARWVSGARTPLSRALFVKDLGQAIEAAGTLLPTIPSTRGVAYDAQPLGDLLAYLESELGWR
jgi:hypothetical protein